MKSKPFVIVVGTDFSPYSERALRAAYEQARHHPSAELHLAHASSAGIDSVFPAPAPLSKLGEAPLENLDALKERSVEHLDAFIATLAPAERANVRFIAHVLHDTPLEALTWLASELQADLIVVGTHGRRGVARWLLGSVADGVVRQASCPVLVVPPEPDSLRVPRIEPPCPRCVEARTDSAGVEIWCAQHRERHGRRHTYHQGDRVGAETNLPLVTR